MGLLSLLALVALVSPSLARTKLMLGGRDASSNSTRRFLKAGKGAGLGDGFWSVQGSDFVDSNGNKVVFSGVNWSGFETPKGVVGGLHKRLLGDYMDQMRELGFNMIRLPFAGESLKDGAKPAYGMVDANPDFEDLTSLEIMDKVIEEAGKRGIKVILDYHRMHRTYLPEYGLWFDDQYPESNWLGNWAMLAKRYQGNPTIIGADLFNEVHQGSGFPGPFWVEDAGNDEKYNWRSATMRAINAIHSKEPNWIIFIEGFGASYWWGGNCRDLLKYPIDGPEGKIAYSSHDYGPSVDADQWQFKAKEFPDNLKGVMREHWGFLIEDGVGALWVGEFGSPYPQPTSERNIKDRQVFEHQISYINQIKASWTVAFWGPDTGDTGSVLNDDWTTVNAQRMTLLSPIMWPDFA